jgi:parallel beta-helix repeat protein
MKNILAILLLCVIFAGIGCDSDSDSSLNSRFYGTSPIGPTKTLDVPEMYNTIQDAIDDAGSGDFIRVAAGVYVENLLIESKSFSLRGAGRGETIIQGLVRVYDSSEVSFEGFTFMGGGLHVRNSPVRITGNEIIDNPGVGLWLERSVGFIISDNEINNNGREGILIDDSAGVIGNTRINENKADGIVINNSSPTLAGNSVLANARDGISIRGFVHYSSPLLLENIIRDNGGVSNYDIICFGAETNPTGVGNIFNRCINCIECRSFGNPVTYRD